MIWRTWLLFFTRTVTTVFHKSDDGVGFACKKHSIFSSLKQTSHY